VLLSFENIVQQKKIIVAVGKLLPVMRIVAESCDFSRSVRQTPHIDVGGEGVDSRHSIKGVPHVGVVGVILHHVGPHNLLKKLTGGHARNLEIVAALTL
jgi:hypothetical protein